MTKTRAEIEAFLYHENELLDEWKLEEWAALFTDTGSYLIPPLKNPTANPATSLFYVHDDRKRLEDRAKRLLKKEAHVEYPHSKTLRNISNVRIKSQEDNKIVVRCNFTTYRTKRDVIDTFIGVQDYHLIVENDALKIQEKKVTLQLDSLRPHGKISLIL
ncbi:aromatic-ring-hydroxylating dioxygenase subunit beta [Sporosarcina pasteurii]|uniref:2-halobenzoate 1,2-dioxygenase small subunit n=1 Tax=Sporosarcina pasteurii TaxID=1474 RepID=A0A380BYR2_SPOPA|nr:aromatic-ring-hydroxylating dioxygenase subunit beta [Sporosarcina pasteurii]MDS9471413.1 aromatic-ring-hydroxylating dioxygenase subunit beta [Sporosarcina pasteurii]QBQ04961.1 p-cumate dioxygenase [Sporosarcina pasteurii]SUJ08961.1 2-halobenzoate 1,2-dioxygenase small subunit [Sporosarcina pasteurii]